MVEEVSAPALKRSRQVNSKPSWSKKGLVPFIISMRYTSIKSLKAQHVKVSEDFEETSPLLVCIQGVPVIFDGFLEHGP